MLNPDGVTRTQALGRERLARKLSNALPGGENPLRAALWEFMPPMLSPHLAQLNRDAFVLDEALKSTVRLEEAPRRLRSRRPRPGRGRSRRLTAERFVASTPILRGLGVEGRPAPLVCPHWLSSTSGSPPLSVPTELRRGAAGLLLGHSQRAVLDVGAMT